MTKKESEIWDNSRELFGYHESIHVDWSWTDYVVLNKTLYLNNATDPNPDIATPKEPKTIEITRKDTPLKWKCLAQLVVINYTYMKSI